jgi:hypothetical protein
MGMGMMILLRFLEGILGLWYDELKSVRLGDSGTWLSDLVGEV